MLSHARCRRDQTAPLAVTFLALAVLGGCSANGDFGRVQPSLVRDDIHDWVGRDAARRAGAPVSTNNLTEDERELRDLAFPLIEPPYDRQRWDQVVFEYGMSRSFERKLWAFDPTAYYRHLEGQPVRSSLVYYNRLIDDARNDIVRIEPFFVVAHRVADLDRRRQEALAHIGDLNPVERANAQARVGENALVIAWVDNSLNQRCAGYRFALERLAVGEPELATAEADRVLTQLQQQIAANQNMVVPLRFAALPIEVATRQAPVTK